MRLYLFRSSPAFGRWVPVGLLFLASCLTFGVYYPGLGAGFVLDDVSSVTLNRSIRDLSHWDAVFSPDPDCTVGGRPVANATFALNYAFGRLDPWVYRLTNLLIHIGNAWLLFALLLAIDGARGRRDTPLHSAERVGGILWAFAATLWVLHPICTGTVAYISQRTELLMGTFYLSSTLLFFRSVASSQPAAWLGGSIVCCFLGMASKEVMVTAPAVILALDYLVVSRSFLKIWRSRGVYYLGLASSWLLLAYLMHDLSRRAVGFGLGTSHWQYALTECKALGVYFSRVFWPTGLVFDYGPVLLPYQPSSFGWLFAPLFLLAVITWAWRRALVLGVLGGLWLVLLSPTSSIIPVSAQPIAENRAYLPSVVLLVGVLLCALRLRAPVRWMGCAVAVGVLALLSAPRVRVLADPVALWQDTIQKAPDNPRAYSNLGEVYFVRGELPSAVEFFGRAIALKPDYPEAQEDLGIALAGVGDLAKAKEHLEAALRLEPKRADFHDNLGNLLLQMGDAAMAETHFKRALELNPDLVPALNNLGGVYFRRGDLVNAEKVYRRAVGLSPATTPIQINLGFVLLSARKAAEARQVIDRVVQREPANPDAQFALGSACLELGDLPAAIAALQSALPLTPQRAEVAFRLGNALAAAGRGSEAIAAYESALCLRPGWPEAEAAKARLLRQVP